MVASLGDYILNPTATVVPGPSAAMLLFLAGSLLLPLRRCGRQP
jgi:hypothetical protein